MFQPLSPDQFYYDTLQKHGLDVKPEDVVKVAEAKGVDPRVAQIAKVFHDQMVLDGVKFASPQLRLEDAFKMAGTYVAHVDACTKNANKLAGDLARICKHAAEGYLAQHGIDLSPKLAVKIAAAEVEEEEEDEEEEDAED